ncbi:hypothetical protein FHR22_000057 [Sphingopyxis panaciterrae]|uniref:hypothetical protein n=1 Tax=Sphingopyxis panaciterrae TaxID=363841 RepID=UPI0014233385|nr:hypothetical protein [Sphingopyxis panaciterrae]NIJ35408.1 hypothetical protein [Sphingopyxis panaciterrae]
MIDFFIWEYPSRLNESIGISDANLSIRQTANRPKSYNFGKMGATAFCQVVRANRRAESTPAPEAAGNGG